MRQEQIGFEKKSRPADHLFVLKAIIDSYTNQGKKVYACFVDFQKAFDSVWRTGLFYKLINYGANLSWVKLIKNMYDKTRQCLKINEKKTREFKTYRGVRQGCILSPKLFNIFINDIPTIFDTNCNPISLGPEMLSCLMYADDLIMLSESEEGLQNCLNKLNDYTNKWQLDINIKKTKVVIFQNGGRQRNYNFKIGNQNIDLTKNYKYLGTTITNTGNFKLNEVNLKKKGLRASYMIIRNIGYYGKPSSAIRIFEKVIEPILTYNCEIASAFLPKSWNYEKFKDKMWEQGNEINKVVTSFLRQILGVHKKTTNIAIFAETGKYPIITKIYSYIFKYWLRLVSCENKLLAAAHNTNIENNKKGKQSWIRIIEYLMKATGMVEITAPNDQKENKEITQNFYKKIIALFEDQWQKQTTSIGQKLDFYYKHKKTFKYESYLDNINRNTRIQITRLRLSSHCLPIEILRYKNIKREERICNICRPKEMGDEEHYLIRCNNNKLKEIRNNFIKEIKDTVPQLTNFNTNSLMEYCMNMKDVNTQKTTAVFVKKLLKAYKEEVAIPPLHITCEKVITKLYRSSTPKQDMS